MAEESQAPEQAPGHGEPNHGLRIFVVWIILSVVGDLLLWFVLGPHLPPGTMSSSAREQQSAIKLMSVMAAPVLVGVVTYFIYAMTVWRHRQGDDEDGPPLQGHRGVQTIWIVGTTVVVLALAVYGTVALFSGAGTGAGEGPAPIFTPDATTSVTSWQPGQILQVQVIAQQWKFTYRYPQLGGFETADLVVPINQWVQFNVTSLDVIHSFWAYQLGVKADANPGVNNIAYTKPDQLGTVTVRCAELCGLWHGAMFDYGHVVTLSNFMSWVASTKIQLASVTKILNNCAPYATTYDPTIITRCLGPVMIKLGLTSAGGGYYPPQDPSQP